MRKLFLIVLFSIFNSFISEDNSMDYIIDNIYLGNSDAAQDEEFLKQYNITAVVNCAEDFDSDYKDLKFMELNLYDLPAQKLFPKFEVAYEFIKKHSEGNILIHCMLGMSRSASLVIFYLMKEKGWDFDTCFPYVKERRPIVRVNEGFEEQLRNYYDEYIRKIK